MKTKELIIVVISVILALVVINLLWGIAIFLTRIIVFLAVVFVIYLLLKKVL